MPLVYQQHINPLTKLGVWHIAEPEAIFLAEVPLQRTITHPNKRLQHLAGRYLLKELYPDFPYALIEIADTRKPFLANEAYHFSISHCADYAAAMVSKAGRVGVDVEKVTNKVEKVKHKFLSSAEYILIDELVAAQPSRYFQVLTATWSIKEALFKWYGAGEVDFIEHLQINQINLQDNSGSAHCSIHKDIPVPLLVHFLFFEDNCLSWVVS